MKNKSISAPFDLCMSDGYRVFNRGWVLPVTGMNDNGDDLIRPESVCFNIVFNRVVLRAVVLGSLEWNIPHMLDQAIEVIADKWSAGTLPYIYPLIDVYIYVGDSSKGVEYSIFLLELTLI